MEFKCKCCGGKFEKKLTLKQKTEKYKPKFCSRDCSKAYIKKEKIKLLKKQKKGKVSKEERVFGDLIERFFPSLKRQYKIKGYYHAYDFYIPDHNLILEYDGKFWHSKPKAQIKDRKHDIEAKRREYKICRITDQQWKEFFKTGIVSRDKLVKLIIENTLK